MYMKTLRVLYLRGSLTGHNVCNLLELTSLPYHWRLLFYGTIRAVLGIQKIILWSHYAGAPVTTLSSVCQRHFYGAVCTNLGDTFMVLPVKCQAESRSYFGCGDKDLLFSSFC